MSFVNYAEKKIHCKVVYYGPGLGGKTTNIQYVYRMTSEAAKGQMVSLNTDNERTLFFDFLPLNLGSIRGFETRFHLYTVPGQVFYEASRKLILRGVDGIIFVADSQLERMDENVKSLEDLKKNLKILNIGWGRIPLIFQWNKRDLPHITEISQLSATLNPEKNPEFQAVARSGQGVFETLKAVSKMVLVNIKGGLTDNPTTSK